MAPTIRSALLAAVHELDDLELAILLCLMSSNHAIIQSSTNALENLEIQLLEKASNTFGLTSTRFCCDASTTLQGFTSSLLIEKSSLLDSLDYSGNDGLCIPNLVIIRDLQLASQQVQVQALELMRTRRIFTRTAVQAAPKHFLLIITSSTRSSKLSKHLRDRVYLSHIHEASEDTQHKQYTSSEPAIGLGDIEALSRASNEVVSAVELTRYLNDVVIFLRLHRAIAAGTDPMATKYLKSMVDCLAVLHGLSYITPSLVILAVPKIFRHRLVLIEPIQERSLQYGSDLKTVHALLDEVTVDNVLEDVINTVECPL